MTLPFTQYGEFLYKNLDLSVQLMKPDRNSVLLQPKNSPLKGLPRKQNRKKFQYRKWTIGAAKMWLSIFCVRDYLSIFYIGIFHGSSVLANPFNGRLLCLQQTRFYTINMLFRSKPHILLVFHNVRRHQNVLPVQMEYNVLLHHSLP